MLGALLLAVPPGMASSEIGAAVVSGKKQAAQVNHWRIPDWLENEVKLRDRKCVYCGIQMLDRPPTGGHRGRVATWEHILNDARIIRRENIARCCASCNSSKGNRGLSEWLRSDYCKKRGITADTVAPVIAAALAIPNGKSGPSSVAWRPLQGAGSPEP